MDLCDIHIGEKYILNVDEYANMDFNVASWMSRLANARYGELPVVVKEIDDSGDLLDVLILPSYDDLPIIPNRDEHYWWVNSKCLHELCTKPALQNSKELDTMFLKWGVAHETARHSYRGRSSRKHLQP